MGFAVDTSWTDGCAVISVAGELDMGAESIVRACLEEVFAAPGAAVVLDLSATTFMDARGISILVAARAMAERSRVAFHVVGIRPRLRSTLKVVGLDTVFPDTHPDPYPT
ncbi:STAS domain-containing protein [Spongiactinospora gelatinilytica]|nr:STAS domain-containing protein [Spongiactinospora gelatinilytica]